MSGGRWAVVTGQLVTQHRSLTAARAERNRNATLHAQLRRWSRRLVRWDADASLWVLR